MAAQTKKRSSTKKRTGSTSGRRSTAAKKQQEKENFTKEVVLWLILAISVLLFISNFGIGGKIGNTVSGFFFGVFGLIAYIFPIVLLIGTFFAVSNKGNRIATVKIVAVVLAILFLCLFIELILRGADVIGAVEVYHYCFEKKLGGGFLGGFMAKLCVPNFGVVGTYVIDAVMIIICLVLITEKSALRGVQKGGRKVYETAKENNERHRERVEQRREERELRRMDKKVEGVAIDTRVLPTKNEVSDEVSEINIEQYFEMPEVTEENHVTLTSGGMEEVMPSQEEMVSQDIFADAIADESISSIDIQAIHEESLFSDMPEEPTFSSMPAQSAFDAVAEQEVSYSETPEIHSRRETVPEMPSAFSEEAMQAKKQPKPSKEEIETGISDIQNEIMQGEVVEKKYEFPPIDLLAQVEKKQGDSRQHLQETANKLQQTLKNFGVNVTITNVSCGPAVTRYELQPEMGVKVSKIVNLADDIKLNLAAADIRIEAPIPGKAAVGIEVPNKENVMVSFRELIESNEFQSATSNIAFAVGRDIAGKVNVTDIAKMPHLLIAGATGSGKSVCINTIIMSILYKADPKNVKFIMIDPKVVELSVYNGIPHLMIPVVTDPKKAAGALHWAVAEMTDRYQKFADAGVRDLKGYNAKVESLVDIEGEDKPQKLPQIVIIVDELADLMMVASNDVEEAICRLAQLARACGIHLIIATQRPSVNVITGLIKANMPSRIAFAVTSGIDSRTILDMNGAEKLLGKGDMLFNPQGVPKPIRIQGAFVSDKEVSDVVSFLKEQNNGMICYSKDIEEKLNNMENSSGSVGIDGRGDSMDGRDAYFAEAAQLLIEKEKGSIGMLQRYFKVGFNRAARIMDQLEEAGIVGPEEGTKPRRVLMSAEQFEQYKEEYL